MSAVGLPDLQRHAAALIRRAETGETITVEVDGREVAELTRVRRNSWRSGGEIAAIFDGPADLDWAEDRDTVDGAVQVQCLVTTTPSSPGPTCAPTTAPTSDS
jgi:antitoxin (DNA-binding transcriptional repressor) of toxin-antitoxin stability system